VLQNRTPFPLLSPPKEGKRLFFKVGELSIKYTPIGKAKL
jgi:hypothetical protein